MESPLPRRIFFFDERSLNSSSDTSTSQSQSTTTINDYSLQSSDTQDPAAGIYEDHPGLNPDSERVCEQQCEIREALEQAVQNAGDQRLFPNGESDYTAAAELLHGESNNTDFMQSIVDDLTVNGAQGETYREAIQMWVDMVSANSPLEQFAILPLIPMNIGNLYFSFTNPSLFMLLTLSLVLLLLHFVTKNGGGNSVPNAWQSLVELIYDFVPNPVNEQIGGLSGNVKQKFFPCISVTFTFSLFRNPQGMIPYSFTVTSHFLITLGLSFSIFIGITIVGFQRNGLHFLSFSLPAGVPLPLAPFLVLLELISYCFRALSLGIRLFANHVAAQRGMLALLATPWPYLLLPC